MCEAGRLLEALCTSYDIPVLCTRAENCSMRKNMPHASGVAFSSLPSRYQQNKNISQSECNNRTQISSSNPRVWSVLSARAALTQTLCPSFFIIRHSSAVINPRSILFFSLASRRVARALILCPQRRPSCQCH